LIEVGAMRDLEELWLSGLTLRKAEDIDRLAHLRNLRLLSVGTIELNHEVLSSLPRLAYLDVLFLSWHHGLSGAELDRLRELLPNTEVTYLDVKY
jgi:hypothetical protein